MATVSLSPPQLYPDETTLTPLRLWRCSCSYSYSRGPTLTLDPSQEIILYNDTPTYSSSSGDLWWWCDRYHPGLEGGNQSIVQILWRHRKRVVLSIKWLYCQTKQSILMTVKVFRTFGKSAAAGVFIVWLNQSLWSLCQTPGWTLYPVGNIFQRWKEARIQTFLLALYSENTSHCSPFWKPSVKKDLQKEHNLLKTWRRHNNHHWFVCTSSASRVQITTEPEEQDVITDLKQWDF